MAARHNADVSRLVCKQPCFHKISRVNPRAFELQKRVTYHSSPLGLLRLREQSSGEAPGRRGGTSAPHVLEGIQPQAYI